MEVIPLIKGTHVIGAVGETGVNIADHTGSVTLIQSGANNILVDVGGRGQLEKIRNKLSERGLTIENINLIVLTHFHLDHAFNIAVFPKARVIGWSHEWGDGETFRFKNIQGHEIADGVSLLTTPGHTPEHLSVVVKTDNGRKTVISGDAINQHYLDTKKISAYFFDEGLYKKSADSLLEIADEFIMGHG